MSKARNRSHGFGRTAGLARGLAVLLAVAAVAGLSATDYKNKLEISVALWDIQIAFAGPKDDVLKYIEDKFNIVIKPVNITWDDWNMKPRLWAAANQMPDIITNDYETRDIQELNKMIKQGVFRTLPGNLDAWPNVKAAMNLPDVKPLAIGGKFYDIPRLNSTDANQGYGSDRTIIVRKDWMKKAGITKVPETFDEFYALAKALTDKSKGIYGLSWGSLSGLDGLIQPESPAAEDWVQDAGGKWVPNITTDSYVRALTQVTKLYRDGLLDPDVVLFKGKEGLDKFAQGKVGMIVYNGGPSHLKEIADRWSRYNNPPMADAVVQIPFWKNSDGKVYYHVSAKWWSASYFSANVTQEKLERILDLYDFLLSPDGIELSQYGVPGKDYTKNGSTITVTREKDPNGSFVSLGTKYPSMTPIFTALAMWTNDVAMWQRNEANRANFGEAPLNIAMDSHDWRMKNAIPSPRNWDIFFMDIPNKQKFADITPASMVRNDSIKVMIGTGKDDVAVAWKKVLAGYRAQGMDKVIADVNAALKKK